MRLATTKAAVLKPDGSAPARVLMSGLTLSALMTLLLLLTCP